MGPILLCSTNLGSVSKLVIILLRNGMYLGCNPLIRSPLILTSCDIQGWEHLWKLNAWNNLKIIQLKRKIIGTKLLFLGIPGISFSEGTPPKFFRLRKILSPASNMASFWVQDGRLTSIKGRKSSYRLWQTNIAIAGISPFSIGNGVHFPAMQQC